MASKKDKPLSFTLIEGGSRQGRNLLVSSDGNTYHSVGSSKKGTSWKCSGWSFCKKNDQVLRKNCSAAVSEINKSFFSNCQPHNHPTRSNILESILHRYQRRKLASLNTSSEMLSMYDEQTGCVSYGQTGYHKPKFKSKASLLSSFYKYSHDLDLKEPTDIHFDVDCDYLNSCTSDSFFRCDLQGRKTRHLVFATDEQLEILSGAKLWVISSSLKFSNSVFSQLLVVHVYGHKPGENQMPSAFPCLFVLMSRRRTSDYRRVFHAISNALPSHPKVKEVVICYDSALLEAFQPLFPLVTIRIDLVRWWKALRAQIGDLQLEEIFVNKRQAHNVIRKLFALPFVLQENIRDGFEFVVKEASEVRALETILDSVRAFWIDNKLWSNVRVSVFGKYMIDEIVYDDWIESLSKKLLSRRYKFYFLVPRLYREATSKPADFKVLSARSLQEQFEDRISNHQVELCQLWARYIAKEFELDELLVKCSHFYCRRYCICHQLFKKSKSPSKNNSKMESEIEQ